MTCRLPERLTSTITGVKRCGVLFSGGADSEALLRATAHLLGRGNILSLTAVTPLLASYHRDHIVKVVEELGLDCVMLSVDPMADYRFTANRQDRCYICKRLILEGLSAAAEGRGFHTVADGTVPEDLLRDRPGLVASVELKIWRPFVESNTGEEEVRRIGLGLGADPAGRPSDSCLATRISPELEITPRAVSLVEAMEAPIRSGARGRVRALLGPRGIDLQYTERDMELVQRFELKLAGIASEHGVELRLVVS